MVILMLTWLVLRIHSVFDRIRESCLCVRLLLKEGGGECHLIPVWSRSYCSGGQWRGENIGKHKSIDYVCMMIDYVLVLYGYRNFCIWKNIYVCE